jgi:hypothetical protein
VVHLSLKRDVALVDDLECFTKAFIEFVPRVI